MSQCKMSWMYIGNVVWMIYLTIYCILFILYSKHAVKMLSIPYLLKFPVISYY